MNQAEFNKRLEIWRAKNQELKDVNNDQMMAEMSAHRALKEAFPLGLKVRMNDNKAGVIVGYYSEGRLCVKTDDQNNEDWHFDAVKPVFGD